MKLPSIICRHVASVRAAALLSLLGVPVYAATYTWQPTSGGPYDWNSAANWDPNTGFPSASSEVANVTSDLTAALTIRLRQPISVGTLNLGDTSATGLSFGFTIANLTGETHALTFDSGDPNVAAKLNLQNTGTPNNTISAPIVLNSALAVNMSGSDLTNAQRLIFSNTVSTQDQPITLTGGVFNSGAAMTISGNLLGGAAALVTNNSLNPLVLNAANPNYSGKFVINNRATGSNQAGLTLTTGSIANASELVINGYLSAGITQNGGGVHSGNNNGAATNPGQRFTQNRITLNGGTLNANGQLATTGVANTWQQGLEAVQDNLATMDFNSGFSHIVMSLGGNTAGTILNIATVERSPGASLYLRSSTLGQATGSKFLVGNANAFMRGAGGPVGSTTMSIIPWLAANNTGTATGIPTGFATNTPNGIRALFTSGEYAVLISAGSGANVDVTSFTPVASPTIVNSLRFGGSGASNIGVGQVLTLASGGLFLAANNGAIGAAGNAAAGTLNFGSAEGVVWSNGTNTNGIGASITGTGGLSKAGTGTLTLTGVANDFSGLTYVGGGALQIGTVTNPSNLGLSNEVAVAAGAQLTLAGVNDMVLDTATLRLEQFGLFNGKVDLFTGLNEAVGALWFGGQMMPPGTYGSALSGAPNSFDQWFSGTGTLTVVPEPATATLFLGGIALIAGRRRRK